MTNCRSKLSNQFEDVKNVINASAQNRAISNNRNNFNIPNDNMNVLNSECYRNCPKLPFLPHERSITNLNSRSNNNNNNNIPNSRDNVLNMPGNGMRVHDRFSNGFSRRKFESDANGMNKNKNGNDNIVNALCSGLGFDYGYNFDPNSKRLASGIGNSLIMAATDQFGFFIDCLLLFVCLFIYLFIYFVRVFVFSLL